MTGKKKMSIIGERQLWKFMIFTLMVILFTPPALRAATSDTATSETGTSGTGTASELALEVAGSIAGTFQNVQGTASYTIPIPVPSGRNGMEPQLNLSYNSQTSDGPVGIGWRLDAGLMITRGVHTTERSNGYDNKTTVAYDDTDQLVLNGKELKLISGSHLNNGAVYMSAIDSGMQILKTSAGFTGKAKDGRTLEFEHAWTVDGTIVGWGLSAVYDSYGNGVIYNYLAGTDVPYLESIRYTIHDPIKGFVNTGGTRSTKGYVYFNYSTYGSQSRVVVNGETFYNTHLLDYILVSPETGYDDPDLADQWQRYDFTYENALSGFGVKRLQSIQVTEKRDDVGHESTYPKTSFNYNDSLAQVTSEFSEIEDLDISRSMSNADAKRNRNVYADYNGDGISDLMVIRYVDGRHKADLYINDGSGRLTHTAKKSISPWRDVNGKFRHSYHAADTNEDGQSELIEVYMAPNSRGTHYEIRVNYWAYNKTSNSLYALNSADRMVATRYVVGASNWNLAWESSITDWNADGRSDLIIYGRLSATGTTGLWVSPHLNQGDGTFEENTNFSSLPYADVNTYNLSDYRRGQYEFLDVTDDGKPDLVEIYKPEPINGEEQDIANVRVFENTGYGISEIPWGGWHNISWWYNRTPSSHIPAMMAYYQFADMNMDGRTDLVVVNRDYHEGCTDVSFFRNNGNGRFIKKSAQTIRTVTGLAGDFARYVDPTPRHLVADFTNDGYPDIMIFDYDVEADAEVGIKVFADLTIHENNAGVVGSTGSFAQRLETTSTNLWVLDDLSSGAPPVQPMLFDSDSGMDLVETHEFENRIYVRTWTRNEVQPPDLLQRITDGRGVKTSIFYENAAGDLSVHGNTFYTPSSSGVNIDNQFDMTPGHYLLSSYTITQPDDTWGELTEISSTFRYKGYKYDYVNGSLGFEEIYTYNELTGHYSSTRYYQEYPKAGYKKSVSYHHGQSGEPNLVDFFEYTADNYPGTTDVWMVQPSTTKRLLQQNGTDVDGVGDRWSEYFYDSYGRLDYKTDNYGGSGYADRRILKTSLTYATGSSADNTADISAGNLDAYHLGFPDTSTTVEIDTSGAEITGSRRQTGFTYTAGLAVESTTNYMENSADNITIRYEYDDFGNIIKEYDGANNLWRSSYDNNRQFVISKTNPLGHKKEFTQWDKFTGGFLQMTDENMNFHTVTTGAFGRPDSRIGPGSATAIHKMEGSGTTQAGFVLANWSDTSKVQVSMRKHDNLGRVLEEAGPDTPYHAITWGAHGKPVSEQVIQPGDWATKDFVNHTYTYDAWMNQKTHARDGVTLSEEVRDYSAGTLDYRYPSPKDDLTITVSIENNALGKVATRTLSGGDIHTYEYNIYGQVTSVTDPTGQTITYDYDMAGRLIEQSAAETGTVAYAYDRRSLVTERTNADGKIITMSYDALGRLTHRYTQGHSNGTWYLKRMEYDNPLYSNSKGRLTDIAMTKTTNCYDGVWNNATWLEKALYSYNYDANGNISTHTRKVTNSIGYDTYTFQSTYHPDGTPDTITYPDGSKVRYILSAYLLPEVGCPVTPPKLSLIQYAENGVDFVTVKNYNYYNHHGQNTEARTTLNLQTGKTIYERNEFGKHGLLNRKSAWDYGGSIGFEAEARQRGELGFVNRVDTRTSFDSTTANATTDYAYSDEGWLTSANNTDPSSYGLETYTYLSDGRRDEDQTYIYDWDPSKAHQLLAMTDSDWVMADEQISMMKYAYDANGAMTDQLTLKWKSAENRHYKFQRRVFAYDADNMPETEDIQYLNTGKWSGQYIDRSLSYDYDHSGKRFYKKITAAGTTVETHYLTSSFVAEKTTSNGKSVMEYTKNILGIGGIVASLKTSDTAAMGMAPLVPFNSRWMAADMYRWDSPMGFITKIGTYTQALLIHPKTVEWVYLILKSLPAALILSILIALLISSRGRISYDSFRYRYPVLAKATWAVLFFFAVQLMPALPRHAFAAGTGQETYETYYRDLFGNTVMTLQASSSDPKDYVVLSHTAYRPFGGVDSNASSNTEKTRYTFSGKEIDFLNSADGDQGPVYFGARYYDSFSGRFLTPDPKAQFTDPYMYCWNSPQNAVDPDGQFIFLLMTALVVSAIVYGIAKAAGAEEVAEGALMGVKVTGGALGIILGVQLGIAAGIGCFMAAVATLPATAAISTGVAAGLASATVGVGVAVTAAGVTTRFVLEQELAGNMMMYIGVGLVAAGVCTLSLWAAPWAAQTSVTMVATNLMSFCGSWYFGGATAAGYDATQWDYDNEKVWGYSMAQVTLDLGMGHFSGAIGTKMNKMVQAGKIKYVATTYAVKAFLGGLNGAAQNMVAFSMMNKRWEDRGKAAALGFAAGAALGGAGYGLGNKLGGGAVGTTGGFLFGWGGVFARLTIRDATIRHNPKQWAE